MAATYLKYSPTNSTHGKFIQSVMTGLETSRNLTSLLQTFNTMIDGDGSSSSQFTVMQTAIGAPDLDTAKGIWDELNSLNAKLITDGSVTFVNSAINQAIAKLKI